MLLDVSLFMKKKYPVLNENALSLRAYLSIYVKEISWLSAGWTARQGQPKICWN